ncbi:MAG: hypothetical protein KDI60_20915, partial [Xanthomonadales bacterium]|nr:hypothetical protein [Xanthomonadales bacterium]
MKKTLLCAALAAAAALPMLASAAPREAGQWYVSPMVGYGFSDEDRVSDNGLAVALGAGYVFKDNWTVEGTLRYNKYDRNNGDNEP